jgi:hypothetical protein
VNVPLVAEPKLLLDEDELTTLDELLLCTRLELLPLSLPLSSLPDEQERVSVMASTRVAVNNGRMQYALTDVSFLIVLPLLFAVYPVNPLIL